MWTACYAESMHLYLFLESLRLNQLRRAALCVLLAALSSALVAVDPPPGLLIIAVVGQLAALALLPFRRAHPSRQHERRQ